ncbi:hypothetical protein PAHAL_3G165500 [Panicum hallii]|jgi:hypothetical protein|uniref:Uncharacterized protein n=1 Tax=Panicum hallii TaxID=206008 RepID=A0A2S3H989_9POAL|nr:hypothetical protein PAHAL_3G165500 [Panicum hallii]PAN17922.1 hypothetical protein PAHAL_3G165500 [Panicum hallii]
MGVYNTGTALRFGPPHVATLEPRVASGVESTSVVAAGSVLPRRRRRRAVGRAGVAGRRAERRVHGGVAPPVPHRPVQPGDEALALPLEVPQEPCRHAPASPVVRRRRRQRRCRHLGGGVAGRGGGEVLHHGLGQARGGGPAAVPQPHARDGAAHRGGHGIGGGCAGAGQERGAQGDDVLSGRRGGVHRGGRGEVVPGHLDGDAPDLLARERRVREERALHAAAGVLQDALGAAVGHEEEVEPLAGDIAPRGAGAHDVDAEALGGLVLREQGRARDGDHGHDAEHDALRGRGGGRHPRGPNSVDGDVVDVNRGGRRGGGGGNGEEERSLHCCGGARPGKDRAFPCRCL